MIAIAMNNEMYLVFIVSFLFVLNPTESHSEFIQCSVYCNAAEREGEFRNFYHSESLVEVLRKTTIGEIKVHLSAT